MKRFIVRYEIVVTIISIFAVAVIITQNRLVSLKTSVDISEIPLTIGDWSGKEIPIERNITDILETPAVLMRQYTNVHGDRVDLAIVYYKNSRVALHLPESCLLGQGSKLSEAKTIKISLQNKQYFLANQLITISKKTNNLFIYFFETGNVRTNSYLQFRKQMLLNKLRGINVGGALVRFSIDTTSDTVNYKLKTLTQFITAIIETLPKYLI